MLFPLKNYNIKSQTMTEMTELEQLKEKNYILMAICMGNYAYAEQFKKMVLEEIDNPREVRDMMRRGNDCGVIADYFEEGDFDGVPEEEEVVFSCAGCNIPIVRNSWEHDNCKTKDDEDWYCMDCEIPGESDEDED